MAKHLGDKTSRSGKAGKEPKQEAAQRPIGAKGYGLDERQQKLASDLWAWQRESVRSRIVLGGPING